MSYRAFKRLLGETSLERKCRFLFGAGILLLITASFWLYAYQTEHLAYDQTTTTCRALVNQIFDKHHMPKVIEWERKQLLEKLEDNNKSGSKANKEISGALDKSAKEWFQVLESRNEADKQVAKNLGFYQYEVLRQERLPDDYERELFKEFTNTEDPKDEASRLRTNERLLYYYGAVRAQKKCIECHAGLPTKLADNDVTVVKIQMSTTAIEDGVHLNRAVLMATALVTALLIMGGSYVIVRYVIVKPVKHLKEVSDAISAGELNVRSEIQTGDEFEDLSHAFNRMLRNLVSMQDQLRKVNADLDRKVDELAQANMALYESNRLKSDFLATMSHELRTPLNSILGFSEVLLSSDRLNDKQQRWVQQHPVQRRAAAEPDQRHSRPGQDRGRQDAGAPGGVQHLRRLRGPADHVPAAGREEEHRPAQPARPGHSRCCARTWSSCSRSCRTCCPTPSSSRRRAAGCCSRPRPTRCYVVLTVTDTGVGIAPEEQELVFEKFRQSGNPLTREHAGTGLGLSIVRELSKLLGGEVTLQSELGRGSTFTVRLPLQLSEEPRLEFDLADEGIDLSKAQRVDVRLYAGGTPALPITKVDRTVETRVEMPQSTPVPGERET